MWSDKRKRRDQKFPRFDKENMREAGRRGSESHVASPAKPTSSSLWRYESSRAARARGVWPGNLLLAGTEQVVPAWRARANYNRTERPLRYVNEKVKKKKGKRRRKEGGEERDGQAPSCLPLPKRCPCSQKL